MPKPKKKRTKTYKPRQIMLPPMVLGCLPEMTDKERADLDLAGLLPLDCIKRGEGTMRNCQDVLLALKSGFVTAERFDDEWRIKLLMQIAYCGITVAANYIEAKKPIQPWMTDPAEDALKLLCDMEAHFGRVELCLNHQKTIHHRERICRFDMMALNIADPSSRTLKNAVRMEDEPISGLFGMSGITYLHNSALTGYLYPDEERGRLLWLDGKTGANIPVERPIMILKEDRNEKPYDWKQKEAA